MGVTNNDDQSASPEETIKRAKAVRDKTRRRKTARADDGGRAKDTESSGEALEASRGGELSFSAPQLKSLESLAKLAHSLLRAPVVIWMLEFPTRRPRMCAAAGVPEGYTTQAPVGIGSGIINSVVETGTLQSVTGLQHSSLDRRRARDSERVSAWGVPIKLRGQVCGVIEVFSPAGQEFGGEELESLAHLADVAGVTVESVYYSLGALKLARIARKLSAVPDFGRVMEVLVENARELTGADSGTIILWERQTDSYTVGARTLATEDPPIKLPRGDGGLTRAIIKTGRTVRINDTGRDRRIREEELNEGVRSLIGVRLQMEEKWVGVLYVSGRREAQFTDYDARLLQSLAGYASVALCWARLLFKPSDQMEQATTNLEQATTNLFNLESVLKQVGKELEAEQDFDFVALQLTRRAERTIETVSGTGLAEKWGNLSWKHYLERSKALRDIQADIALNRPPRIEIIAGWDERFDRWIYEEFDHDKLTRIFAPMVVVRDESGRVVADWLDRCEWRVIPGERVEGGYSVALELSLPGIADDAIEVIGTVEAGYKFQDEVGEPERMRLLADRVNALIGPAQQLFKPISQKAQEIWRARLPYLLQTVTEGAMRIMGADSASVHFPYDTQQRRYVYEVSYGQAGRRFLKECQPRNDRLGRQAIRERKPKFIPDLSLGHEVSALERLNPKVCKTGIKAIAAFPLMVNRYSGVLYLHFQRPHLFTQDEIDWVQLFVNWAVDAIGHYITYRQTRERARQLASLHFIAHSLVSRQEEKNLLRHAAWNTLNTLGADVVTIYEYFEKEHLFVTPPAIAGRLRAREEMKAEIHEDDAPARLIRGGENIYAARTMGESAFNPKARERTGDRGLPFVVRERIHSSAGTLLKVGDETVGVMFVNYRRPHAFSEVDRNTIEILSWAASITIKNRRLLKTLTEVFGESMREIITTLDLDQVLNLVIKRAVEITRADLGVLSRLDPSTQELVLRAKHPSDQSIAPSWERIKMGEGLTGWVAAHKKAALVNDLRTDERHRPFFATDGSALLLPLQDQDGHVLGVMGVKSDRLAAFDRSDQGMLEVLANYAVIAIQNAERQKRLVAGETSATLGEFATQLLHWMKDGVGLIQIHAQEIQLVEGVDAFSRQTAAKIQTLADKIIQQPRRLTSSILTAQELIELSRAVTKAWGRTHVPPGTITLKKRLPADMPKVKANDEQMTDVFVNLIQNAVDAMPKGGTLLITGKSVKLEGAFWAIVRIRDTGVGVTKEGLEKIFQLGYTTKRGAGRMGFGLWWTRTYVERLGGRLTAECRKVGTRFTLLLPAHEPES